MYFLAFATFMTSVMARAEISFESLERQFYGGESLPAILKSPAGTYEYYSGFCFNRNGTINLAVAYLEKLSNGGLRGGSGLIAEVDNAGFVTAIAQQILSSSDSRLLFEQNNAYGVGVNKRFYDAKVVEFQKSVRNGTKISSYTVKGGLLLKRLALWKDGAIYANSTPPAETYCYYPTVAWSR